MKKLLNTLFVMTPGRYLSLGGENVVINEGGSMVARFPLHNFESIVTFGYTGASPALMAACSERGISLNFMSASGRFMARVVGETNGNVILRREQYRIADNEEKSLKIAKNFVLSKLYNSGWILERGARDYSLRLDSKKLKEKSHILFNNMHKVRNPENFEFLRGIEGNSATTYFSCFDDLILNQKNDFYFKVRNKRPPLDNVNALLSFAYTLLAKVCASALEAVGLDPYVGFFHTDRPGRISLALDLMEEFRAVFADRFVLTIINKQMIKPSGFLKKESGAVIMNDEARKAFVAAWQTKKQEEIKHPFIEEKIQWGIVPYVQALLLARYIRGDPDEYPPFMWK